MDLALPGSILPKSTDVEYVVYLNNEGLVSYPTGTYVYFKAKARSQKFLENECITSWRHWQGNRYVGYVGISTKYI